MNNQQNTTQGLVDAEELRARAMQELGIEDFSKEAQDKLLKTIGHTIADYIDIAIMKRLNPEQAAVLAELEGDEQKFSAQIREYITDIDQVISKAMDEAIIKQKEAIKTAIG